jgi:hypothetical protein
VNNPQAIGLTPDEFAEYARLDRLEGSGDFIGGHYDEPNVLAHVRMNDRTGPNGENILHVEEIQSDWAQKGRAEGFRDTSSVKVVQDEHGIWSLRNAATNERIDVGSTVGFTTEEAARRAVEKADIPGVIQGPFVGGTDKWTTLALRWIIRMAVEEGKDRVTFTKGATQADRYDLSKQVDDIEVFPRTDAVTGEKTRSLLINLPDGNSLSLGIDAKGVVDNVGRNNPEMMGKRLDEVIGKDLADKIMEVEGTKSFSGQDLKVGGEGMKYFYDNIIPKNLQKVVKKLDPDAKVGTTTLQGTRNAPDLKYDIEPAGENSWRIVLTGGSEPTYMPNAPTFRSGGDAEKWLLDNGLLGSEVHSIDITPRMREAAKGGQPLFGIAAAAGAVGAAGAAGMLSQDRRQGQMVY